MSRKKRAGLDTDAVVQEAIQLADELGYDKLTLAALAARLGIKTPSLYNHIQGLDDLRQRMAIHGLEGLYSALLYAVKLDAGNPIQAVAKAYVAFADENPGVYAASLLAPDDQVPRWQELGEQIVQLISDLAEPFSLEPDEVIHWVRGFRSMLHGFASLRQAGGFGMPIALDESLQYMVKTYMRGAQPQR